MIELELEIFEQSSDYSDLRLRGDEGLRTRGLDRAVIDQLIEVVERSCAGSVAACRIATTPSTMFMLSRTAEGTTEGLRGRAGP